MSRLDRDDWAQAALEAIASGGGLAAVAIEPIAVRLGATKGSFYWHYRSRAELVESALLLWEQRATADVIARIENAGGSAESRLRLLFGHTFHPENLIGADLALLSQADVPAVHVVVDRVTKKRIAYVSRLFRELGLTPTVARRRAVLAYSAFLGNLQLAHASPNLLRRSVGSMDRYADEVVRILVADA